MSAGEPPTPGKAARTERRKAVAATYSAIGLGVLAALLFQPLATNIGPHPYLVAAAMSWFVASQLVSY